MTEIVERLKRWQVALGEPIGPGRSNPDNDTIYLLKDAATAIERLEARVKELDAKERESFQKFVDANEARIEAESTAARLLAERNVRARLAWNNWPDNETSRREIAAHEARDTVSAASWDRVIASIAHAIRHLRTQPKEK